MSPEFLIHPSARPPGHTLTDSPCLLTALEDLSSQQRELFVQRSSVYPNAFARKAVEGPENPRSVG